MAIPRHFIPFAPNADKTFIHRQCNSTNSAMRLQLGRNVDDSKRSNHFCPRCSLINNSLMGRTTPKSLLSNWGKTVTSRGNDWAVLSSYLFGADLQCWTVSAQVSPCTCTVWCKLMQQWCNNFHLCDAYNVQVLLILCQRCVDLTLFRSYFVVIFCPLVYHTGLMKNCNIQFNRCDITDSSLQKV